MYLVLTATDPLRIRKPESTLNKRVLSVFLNAISSTVSLFH